jgi:hypothetical protein
MNNEPRPIRVLQPGAAVKVAETITRLFDGMPQTRYIYGRGRWRTMPTDRKALRRQADKVAEHLGYVVAHLANMHESYRGAAEVHDTAVLAMLELVTFSIETWDSVRREL